MAGVSNNYNLDLQKLQGQQGTKTINRNSFQQKDSRLSMNGSVFAGKTGGASGTSQKKDYSDMSGDEAKLVEKNAKQICNQNLITTSKQKWNR